MIRPRLSQAVFTTSLIIISGAIILFGQGPIVGDDVWGVTSVLGNTLESIVFTLRWDVHPPLYYALLDVWAIAGNSDVWLKISSATMHATVTALAFNYVLRRENVLAATISAVIVFTMPLLLDYSTKIRMYSLISLLSLSIFYLIEKFNESRNNKYLKWIVLLGISLSNVHAIGILFVFFHYLYGAVSLRDDRRLVLKWSAVHIIVAITALPAIANSILRSASHAIEPKFTEILTVLQNLFVSGPGWLVILSFGIVSWLIRNKAYRHLVTCYLILPVIIFTIISYTFKPLWLPRNFVFALPILGISLAVAISKLRTPLYTKLIAVACLSILNLTYWNLQSDESVEFEKVVNVLDQSVIESEGLDCIISTNPLNTFWTLERYLNKVTWDNPLEVQPPINDRWANIAARLPQSAKNFLRLKPKPNYTETDELVISSGRAKRCERSDIIQTLFVSDGTIPNGFEPIFQGNHYAIYRNN